MGEAALGTMASTESLLAGDIDLPISIDAALPQWAAPVGQSAKACSDPLSRKTALDLLKVLPRGVLCPAIATFLVDVEPSGRLLVRLDCVSPSKLVFSGHKAT